MQHLRFPNFELSNPFPPLRVGINELHAKTMRAANVALSYSSTFFNPLSSAKLSIIPTYNQGNGVQATRLALTSLFMMQILSVQGSSSFLQTLGGTGHDQGLALTNTLTGIAATGLTRSFGAISEDILNVFFNFDGEVDAATVFAGVGSESGEGITTDDEGNTYICGWTNSVPSGIRDGFIAKIFPNMTLAWAKTFGGPQHEWPKALTFIPNYGLYVTGYTQSSTAGATDIFYGQWNTADGSINWLSKWGGFSYDEAYAIASLPSSFVIGGYTESVGAGGQDGLIMHILTNQPTSWIRTYGGPGDDQIRALAVIPGSGNQIAATGFVTGLGSMFGIDVIFLVLSPSDGAVLIAKAFGGTNGVDRGYALQVDPDSIIWLTGQTTSFGAGSYEGFYSQWHPNGTCVSAGSFGNTAGDYSYGLALSPNKTAYNLGYTYNFGSVNTDVLLIHQPKINGLVDDCPFMGSISPNIVDIVPSLNVSATAIAAGVWSNYTNIEWRNFTYKTVNLTQQFHCPEVLTTGVATTGTGTTGLVTTGTGTTGVATTGVESPGIVTTGTGTTAILTTGIGTTRVATTSAPLSTSPSSDEKKKDRSHSPDFLPLEIGLAAGGVGLGLLTGLTLAGLYITKKKSRAQPPENRIDMSHAMEPTPAASYAHTPTAVPSSSEPSPLYALTPNTPPSSSNPSNPYGIVISPTNPRPHVVYANTPSPSQNPPIVYASVPQSNPYSNFPPQNPSR